VIITKKEEEEEEKKKTDVQAPLEPEPTNSLAEKEV
jgi:hypothetical protein